VADSFDISHRISFDYYISGVAGEHIDESLLCIGPVCPRRHDEIQNANHTLLQIASSSMETVCPQCFATIDADDLVSGSELSCPSCGGSFRIQQNLTLPATAIRNSDTVHQPKSEHTVLRPLDGDRALEHPNDDNTISRLDAPNPPPLAVSQQRLGRFILFNVVGSGGFGDVYRAYDTDLQRVVAIKVPKSNIAERPDLLERVHREAKSAGQLHHPAIVAVLEWGESDHLPFIVYEFVTGVTLSQHLSQSGSRLNYRETAVHIRDMAEGLHYAHDHGVTHRDVKPSNIMIDDTGAARLTDFGLAKLQDPETNTLTQTGDVLGTAAYMSPEQALGRIDEIDARSDIYSLGATLYEMLCGRRQFVGNPIELIHKAANEHPSQLRSLDASIPADLEAICHKAVEKEKKHRYQSAKEMADDLDCWLNNRPTGVRRPGPIGRAWRWCRRNRVIAGATAVVLAVMSVATILTGLAYRDSLESLSIANERLSRQYIQKANSYPDEDLVLALPWVSAAAEIDKDVPIRLAAHQMRLAIGLARYPTLEDMHSVDSELKSVAATADGRFVLTLSEDDNIQFWDTRVLGEAVWTWSCGEKPEICELSPRGQFAAVRDEEDRVHVWDTRTGKRTSVLDHQTQLGSASERSNPGSVQFQPVLSGDADSSVVATNYGDYACVWDVRTGEILAQYEHDATVLVAAFDETGMVLRTGATDSMARLWNALPTPPADKQAVPLDSFTCQLPRLQLRGVQSSVVFLGDGPRGTTLTVTKRGVVSVWHRNTSEPIFQSPDNSRSVSDRKGMIAQSPSSRFLALPHGNSTTIWDLVARRMVGDPFEGPSDVSVQRFTDDRILMIGRADGTLDVLSIEDDSIVRIGPRVYHESSIRLVLADTSFATGEAHGMLTYTVEGLVRRWSPPTLTSNTIPTPLKRIEDIQTDASETLVVLHPASPYDPVIVCGTHNESNREMARMLAPEGNEPQSMNVYATAVSPNGKWIAAAGVSGTRNEGFQMYVVIWDAATGQRVGEQIPIESRIVDRRNIQFDSSSEYLMVDCRSSTGAQTAYVWRAVDGAEVYSRKADFTDVFWSSEEHVTYVVRDNVIESVDIHMPEVISTLLQHPAPVTAVYYDPAVSRIVTRCQNDIHCWDAESGSGLGRGATSEVIGRIADLNGVSNLIVLMDSKTVRLHNLDADMSTKAILSTPNDNVLGRLSPDGRLLLLVDKAGFATLWDTMHAERIGRISDRSCSITDAEFVDEGRKILMLSRSRLDSSLPVILQQLQICSRDCSKISLQADAMVASGQRIGEHGQPEPVPITLLSKYK